MNQIYNNSNDFYKLQRKVIIILIQFPLDKKFQKNGQKLKKSKIPSVWHNFTKTVVFIKNCRVDCIFNVENFKNHVLRPIVFDQKSYFEPFLCVNGSKKGFEKISIFLSNIMIFPQNYEKKVQFVQKNEKKMKFCNKKISFLIKNMYFPRAWAILKKFVIF